MKPPTEGSAVFRVKGNDAYWSSDSKHYPFPTVKENGLTISSAKHANLTFAIAVQGLPCGPVQLLALVPECMPSGLLVVFAWTPTRVRLLLNCVEVAAQDT